MKFLTIVTNNAMRVRCQFAAHAVPAGHFNTVGTVARVRELPRGEEIVIARYGVGRVKCEVCTAAEVLVGESILVELPLPPEIQLDREGAPNDNR